MITPTTAPALVLQLGGLALAIDGARFLISAWRSKGWVSSRGRIIASKPVPSPAQVQWGRGAALVWDPGVVYEYVVDGATYRSNRVSFQGHWPSGAGAMSVARRFHVGDEVTVWHDPVNHDRSVLIPGASVANFLQVGAGLLLFGIGLVLNPHPLGAV